MSESRSPNLQLIYVSDISRSTEYYSKVFNCEPKFKSPRYVVFPIDGQACFAIWSGGDAPDSNVPRFSEIGIMLPTDGDVVDLYHQWKNNPHIEISKALYSDVFGQTFLVKDPDGHIIRICSVD